jgi:hypothetical protein
MTGISRHRLARSWAATTSPICALILGRACQMTPEYIGDKCTALTAQTATGGTLRLWLTATEIHLTRRESGQPPHTATLTLPGHLQNPMVIG